MPPGPVEVVQTVPVLPMDLKPHVLEPLPTLEYKSILVKFLEINVPGLLLMYVSMLLNLIDVRPVA